MTHPAISPSPSIGHSAIHKHLRLWSYDKLLGQFRPPSIVTCIWWPLDSVRRSTSRRLFRWLATSTGHADLKIKQLVYSFASAVIHEAHHSYEGQRCSASLLWLMIKALWFGSWIACQMRPILAQFRAVLFHLQCKSQSSRRLHRRRSHCFDHLLTSLQDHVWLSSCWKCSCLKVPCLLGVLCRFCSPRHIENCCSGRLLSHVTRRQRRKGNVPV